MTVKKTSPLETLANRIKELEDTNKKLEQAAPFVQAGAVDDPNAADQGRIVARKNSNPDLVQKTRSGNVRKTFDPSDEFVAEQASGAQYGPEDADGETREFFGVTHPNMRTKS